MQFKILVSFKILVNNESNSEYLKFKYSELLLLLTYLSNSNAKNLSSDVRKNPKKNQ